jgi:choline-sulfatase
MESSEAETHATESLRARIVFMVLLLAAADGAVAAKSTWDSRAGVAATILSMLEVAAFVAGPLAIVCTPILWLASREGSRALGRSIARGLGGGDEANGGVGVLAFVAALVLGAASVVSMGFRVAEKQSPKVAVVVTLSATLGTALIAAALAASIASKYGEKIRSSWERITPRVRFALRSVVLPVLLLIAISRIVPLAFAIPLALGLVGLVVGPRILPKMHLFTGMRTLAAALFAIAAMTFATIALPRSGPAIQVAALYNSPYASQIIALARDSVDADGDGYSPILMGGDCDDHDPNVHPGAIDRPNDGKDQNCSGADAHNYTPPIAPRPAYPTPLPPKLNIVLIQMDALRPDHLGFAGYSRKTSPHLDAFRENATWFKHTFTPAPTTRLAMAAIFTGRDIERVPQRRGPGMDFTLLPEASTIAERLEPLGYDRTGYTISYVLQHIHDVGQGFETWKTPWPVQQWASTYQNAAELTTNDAIAHLATLPQDGSKPYFLFLHYQCTHDPYIKHSQWDYGRDDVDVYDSALSYCDDQLGRLFGTLDARADKGRTAIIIFSDHGELFGEHGIKNHGHSLYEPDVRALLLVHIPGGTTKTVESAVSLVDIDPTILELANGVPDKDSEGWSLVPYVMTKVPEMRRPIFLYGDITRGGVHYQGRGIVEWPYKYIRDISTGTVQLFDIEHDPDELTNLNDTRGDIRDRLAETLDGWEAYEAKR